MITPVYVIPTKSPVTSKPKVYSTNIQEKNIQCDDEEECNEEGSGDPNLTEEIFVTSSTGGSFFSSKFKPYILIKVEIEAE